MKELISKIESWLADDKDETIKKPIEKRQMENEHFVPLLGLDLAPYLESENKNGIHHLGRYLWSIEVLETRKPKRILDIACGAGYGSYLIAEKLMGSFVIGVDYDQKACSYASNNYKRGNLKYMPGDVTKWNFGTFDAIISFDTIEHILHREIMMQNIVNNLSPDGFLILSTPCGRSETLLNPGWEHHKIEYSGVALLDFMKRYFGTVLRPDDGSLPCIEFFDKINKDRIRYLLKMNPILCEDPIQF